MFPKIVSFNTDVQNWHQMRSLHHQAEACFLPPSQFLESKSAVIPSIYAVLIPILDSCRRLPAHRLLSCLTSNNLLQKHAFIRIPFLNEINQSNPFFKREPINQSIPQLG
jgi:hypothetical protein